MKKFLPFLLFAFGISLLVSCSTSKKSPKRESASRVKKKRIPRVKSGKTKEADLKKNLSKSGNRNEELYAFIDKWKGVPHKMGGTSTRGVDCSGLVIQIYKEVYGQDFINRRARDLYTETEAIAKKDLKEGDLVFFKIGSKKINHIGLYLSNGDFVHASSSKGVMVSNLEQAYFKKYFFCGGRKRT